MQASTSAMTSARAWSLGTGYDRVHVDFGTRDVGSDRLAEPADDRF